MATGLKEPLADMPSPKYVFNAEAENIPEEQTLLAQPSPPVTITNVPSQQSPPIVRSLNQWGTSYLNEFNFLETNGNKTMLWRRICMVGILLTEIVDVIFTLWAFGFEDIGIFIVALLLEFARVGFLSMWLAQMGEMSGKRRLFGKVVGRKDYDHFLTSMFVLRLLIAVGFLSLVDFSTGLVWFGLCWWAARITRNPDVSDESMA